ncbi:MAG TPA: hypothetical protein PK054_03730 [Anaerohalosphaeraceae bacterium]|nr:hypothetical protein [Anaerohalosphaeraceae bacterium]HOL88817.1 hypothetical protein [Anaerohalosphaeraceae bacterium]HPP55673.1 hypothetical protein [Anaerohalosphaeraceae bacterium]
MQIRRIGWLFWLFGAAAGTALAEGTSLFPAGQDLHLSASRMVRTAADSQGQNCLLLEEGVEGTIGDNQFSAERAVALLQLRGEASGLSEGQYYEAHLYLEGSVSLKKGSRSKMTVLSVPIAENAHRLAVRFLVTGQVFVTARQEETLPAESLESNPLYTRAMETFRRVRQGPVPPLTAYVPRMEDRFLSPHSPAVQKAAAAQNRLAQPPAAQAGSKPAVSYPIHINALWEPAPEIETRTLPDGRKAATISGRFYLWQKRDEEGTLLEFLADSAVVYYAGDSLTQSRPGPGGNEIASGTIEGVYLAGNIVMTEGDMTIRADEIYYDFLRRQALVVHAELRTFSPSRAIPIYIRAETLRRINETTFEGENVELTDSEFYLPQISVHAARMVLMTTEQLEERERQQAAGENPQADFQDVSFRYGRTTLWKWSGLQTNFARPVFPISRLRVGNDNEFGTSVETRWNLANLLGKPQTEGTDAELALDYFSDRGVGAGIESEYQHPNSFGELLGYVMSYRGTDDLGRVGADRRNLDPEEDIRGRFSWRHRSYLPEDWQLTLEVGYLSDRYFQEWMYRGEYYTDKPQETLVHLKRLKDNWAFSILGKTRINDFETTVEELPTIEYHLKGASFWDHQLTFYSDTQVGRLRNRFDEDLASPATKEDFYTLAYTRNEVDWPLMLGTVKTVPYTAATFAFEDHDEFNLDLDGTPVAPEDTPVLGEYGVRMSTMFWKTDPSVRSRLWDLNGIRHLVKPHFEAVFYEDNSPAVEMRNMYNLGLAQRWQTHRGPEGRQETVDWLRWDLDATWVRNPADEDIDPLGRYGPADFLFSDSAIPLRTRRNNPFFGLVRNTLQSDVEWKVSDTMAVLSDQNVDIDSGQIQQVDVGVNRYVYPELSYYLGSRYLRPVRVDIPSEGIHEEGSHSFVAALTYSLGTRYTAILAQEYNFDYGKTVRSELTLIRRYHRLFYGLSFSLDESLNRRLVSMSIWPQGVKELAIGRRYMGMTEPVREE